MRILWLKTELLHPVDKGGKIRTYQMLKQLKRSHHITYLTLDDGSATSIDREKASEYCDELLCVPHKTIEKFSSGFYVELLENLFSSLPYAIQKYKSEEMSRRIGSLTSANTIDLIVCDFLAPAINMPSSVTCPTILFQHNVEAMIWRRHFEIQKNPVKKGYLKSQWRKMFKFECAAVNRFDNVVAVSEEDLTTMRESYNAQDVFAIPTGVDTEFFRPFDRGKSEPNTLVFTGSMDWLPNQDGIKYFLEEIMPLIKRRIREVRLIVVGRNPPSALIEQSQHDKSIVVTGRVEDVRPYMENASAYIVPLRIGGGTRLKIFEAMAMEMPVISTSIGAEGLPVVHGEDLLLADSPEAFANAVVDVLSSEATAQRLGSTAARTVRKKFSWRQVADVFERISIECVAQKTQQYQSDFNAYKDSLASPA